MSKSAFEAKALTDIKEYLISQNRPYSAVDIFNNLRQEFGKTLVVKALETLTASKEIIEKAVGKQKIYFANQNNFPTFDESELRDLDKEVTENAEALKLEQSEIKSLEIELKSLNSSLTTSQLKKTVEKLGVELSRLNKKLTDLKTNGKQVTPEEKNEVTKLHTKANKEWRSRKRLADQVLGAILENCPKKKKDLYEEIGVETDEDHKVKLPD